MLPAAPAEVNDKASARGAQLLAEVPLEIRVSRQTLAVACGLLSLAAPYLTTGLKSLRLDFEWVGAGFVGLYFWMRPRKRDVFWDVGPKG
jgi:hypothetical protein